MTANPDRRLAPGKAPPVPGRAERRRPRLLSTLDLEVLLPKVLEEALRVLASEEDKGSILLWDEAAGTLKVKAVSGYRDPRVQHVEFPVKHGYAARAARLRTPLVVDDARADAEIRYDGDIEELRAVQSAVVAPLVLQGQLLGALSIDSERPRAFTGEDAEMLVTFAGLAAIALHNARTHQELKRAEEEARQLAQMKADFMIVTSHEMRTPLTVLRGYLEMLGGTPLAAEQAEYVSVCLRTTDRLIGSFSNIVAMLEIESGRLALHCRPCDLRALLAEAEESVAPFLEERGLRGATYGKTALGPGDRGPEKLRLVLLDLLTNAIKFTPDGGEIRVRVAEVPEGHHLVVEDSGVGLEPERLQRVWDAFYTGDDAAHHSSGNSSSRAAAPAWVWPS